MFFTGIITPWQIARATPRKTDGANGVAGFQALWDDKIIKHDKIMRSNDDSVKEKSLKLKPLWPDYSSGGAIQSRPHPWHREFFRRIFDHGAGVTHWPRPEDDQRRHHGAPAGQQ